MKHNQLSNFSLLAFESKRTKNLNIHEQMLKLKIIKNGT